LLLAPLRGVSTLRLSLTLRALLALLCLFSLLSGLPLLALLAFLLLSLLTLLALLAFSLLSLLTLLALLALRVTLSLALLLLTALSLPVGLGTTLLALPFLLLLVTRKGTDHLGGVERISGLLAVALWTLARLAALPVRIVWRVPPLSCRWLLPGRLGDFLINLIGEIFQLGLGPAQGRRFVAQDAPGRAFHTLAHLLDPLAGVPGRLGGVVAHSQLGQLLGGFQRVGDLLFVRLSDGVVEIFGQERLGFLSILDRVFHLIEKLIEVLLLLIESLGGFFAFPGVAKRRLRTILGGFELLGELFLILVQMPRLVAHLGHFLRESVRGSLAKFFAQVIKLPAGPCPFGQGLRDSPFFECLGGLTDMLAALVDLLACVSHPVAILFALHPFPELVGIAQDLLLLISQPLELPLDFLARLRRLGGLEG
jgi:hypothetical protein